MTKVLLFDCAGPCNQEGFEDHELNECPECQEDYCDECFDIGLGICLTCAE